MFKDTLGNHDLGLLWALGEVSLYFLYYEIVI